MALGGLIVNLEMHAHYFSGYLVSVTGSGSLGLAVWLEVVPLCRCVGLFKEPQNVVSQTQFHCCYRSSRTMKIVIALPCIPKPYRTVGYDPSIRGSNP